MFQKNRVDFDWSTFFCTKNEKEKLIKELKSPQTEVYRWEQFDYCIPEEFRNDDTCKQAFKIVVLKFCIEDTSFARDVLSTEALEKCTAQLLRKQYDSKLLKDLLSKFCYLLTKNVQHGDHTLDTLLKLDIFRTVKELREQQAEKNFSPLKKQIEKIASGVKGECYLFNEGARFKENIKSELNNYLLDKYSYDFNLINGTQNTNVLLLYDERLARVNGLLQQALFDDVEFWKKHKDFNVITFVENVFESNDSRHAEKIIDFIFTEISKTQYGKEIIEKSLPLVFLSREEFLSKLEDRTYKFTYDRFKNKVDLEKLSDNKLCYPLSNVVNAEEKLSQGKQLVEEFLRNIYPQEYDHILKLLTDEINAPSAAFSVKQQTMRNVRDQGGVTGGKATSILSTAENDGCTIQNIFDFPTFGYHIGIVDKAVVTVYCPDYFSPENIWNRFYFKAFYMFKLVKNKEFCFANLFEVYYDLFQFIEEKTGIKTSYQRNTEGREEAFVQLKSILERYDVKISDHYKSEYIISLLDRKVAIREESERFPVLEQLGDAIYGIAVAETLFYSGEADDNIAETFERFSRASSQISVAEKTGIDKLYLSSSSLPCKYERDILIDPDIESYILQQEMEGLTNDKKYIADSLEMVIGTICKDCGFKTAINFTKRIFRETFCNEIPSAREIRWEDNHNANIDKDYWTKILPAPYSLLDPNQLTLWRAFDKFFQAYILGTEERKTRRFITYSLGDTELYGDCARNYEANQVFYEYLHKGLDSAIEKFGDSVKEKYKELNN